MGASEPETFARKAQMLVRVLDDAHKIWPAPPPPICDFSTRDA